MVRTWCLSQWETLWKLAVAPEQVENVPDLELGGPGARVALAQIPRLAWSSCCPPSPPPANHSPLCWYSRAHSVLSLYCYLPLLGTVGRRQPLAVRGLPAGCCRASPAYTTGCSGKHGSPHPSHTIRIPHIPDTSNTAHKHRTTHSQTAHTPNTPDTHNTHTHTTYTKYTLYTHTTCAQKHTTPRSHIPHITCRTHTTCVS